MPNRSPIIVLFAATISTNLVAFAWMRATTPLSYGTIVYFAMLVSQLSVVCIWSVLRLTSTTWTLVVSVAAVIACSMAFGLIEDASTKIKDIMPYFGLHAALLLGALWVLRRSAFWRRRSGIQTEWRFSIAQLLVLMTVIGILIPAMGQSTVFHQGRILTALLLAASITIAVASVIIWSCDIHWLLRLAGVLGVAMGLGALFYFVDMYMSLFTLPDWLVQGVVLSAWLAWGGILPPRKPATAVADNLL
jgi:hypothetical protein